MKRLRMDEKGFTMVELIIVIALITVIGSTAFLGSGISAGKKVDGCAQQLSIALQSTRTHAMGKQEGALKLVLKRETNGDIVILEETAGVSGKEEVIGNRELSVSYRLKGETAEVVLPEGGSMVFWFDRSSGVIKPNPDSSTYSEVIISKGDRKRTIKIAGLTGRISLE